MMKTMIALVTVSRRVGHVTFDVSVRTCCRKVNGFVFDAISKNPDSLLKLSSIQLKPEPTNHSTACKYTKNRAQNGFHQTAHVFVS